MKTILGLLFLIVGCALLCFGCDAGPLPSSDVASFLGSWQSSAGSSTSTCAGSTSTTPASYRLTFTQGTTSEALLEDDGSCVAPFALEGDVATAAAGHTCWDRPSSDVTLHVDAETFTTSDGVTGLDHASGRLEGLDASVTCTWEGSATYTRVP